MTVALSGDGGDENLPATAAIVLHLMEEKLRERLPLGMRRAFSACSVACIQSRLGAAGSAPNQLSNRWRAIRSRPISQCISIFRDAMRRSLFRLIPGHFTPAERLPGGRR